MHIIILYLHNILIQWEHIYDAVSIVQKTQDEPACSYDVYKHIFQLA